MLYILLLCFISNVLSKSTKFYTITDNDGEVEFSYLTTNRFKNNKIKVLENISVSPNELSSLKYIDKSLFTTDDDTGLLYKIKHGKIIIYDEENNFYKSETAYRKGKHLYIFNYTKFKKGETRPRDLKYNLVKYHLKRKEIIRVFDLTYMLNQYLKSRGYLAIDINAMDYDEKTNSLYIVPRYYRNFKEKKKFKNDIIIISDGRLDTIKISEKLPKKYGVTDMDIYNDEIYFVAAKEVKLDGGGKDFSSIFFITDMNGSMKTDFIPYDDYNKYEGITVKQ
jgi:hypothetical protein